MSTTSGRPAPVPEHRANSPIGLVLVPSPAAHGLSAGLAVAAGGLPGAALSVFMGWILGKAMVETRGLFWSWWIHFLSDVVIFVFLAASLAA